MLIVCFSFSYFFVFVYVTTPSSCNDTNLLKFCFYHQSTAATKLYWNLNFFFLSWWNIYSSSALPSRQVVSVILQATCPSPHPVSSTEAPSPRTLYRRHIKLWLTDWEMQTDIAWRWGRSLAVLTAEISPAQCSSSHRQDLKQPQVHTQVK